MSERKGRRRYKVDLGSLVTNNASALGKNNYIINPNSNTPVFGDFRELRTRHKKTDIIFPAGPVYLKRGEHLGPERGFGLIHIVAEHSDDVKRQGFDPLLEEGVAGFVADIFVRGIKIHSEFAGGKVMLVKREGSVAVIQLRQDGEGRSIYSVVTAFNGKAKGPVIGTF